MTPKENFEILNQKLFNRISDIWDASFLRLIYFEKLQKKVVNIIRDHILSEGKFLDVACGTAEVIYRLAKEYRNVEFVGVDFSKGMIERAKEKTSNFKNVRIIKANVDNLPFNSEIFDFVICLDSFHHFYDPNLALKEINRVLKKSGLFLLIDPAPDIFYLKPILKIVKNLEKAKDYYSQKDLINYLTKHNFSVIYPFIFYFNNYLLSYKN